MKKTILSIAIIAAAFLAASCQKENLQENIAPEGSASVFTATIESGTNTKTTVERIDGTQATYKTKWESGDKISINGVTYSATPDGTDATKATFTKVGEASNPTPTYKAYFPASLYKGTTATLPANYTYADGKYNMPMYAESETTTLSFKNICAVLAITVTSDDINALKSIKVKSDKKLNGTFTVNSTPNGDYKAVIGSDGSNEVVLSMGETPIDPTTDGTTFYIAIPAQEYSYLKIYLSEDGTLYKRAMITKKAAGLGEIARNTIYNIAYETNAVQLYANGPYWATMNIGATVPTDYGWYFSWGNTTGYVYDSTNKWVKASDNTTKLGTDGSFSNNNYSGTSGFNLSEDIPVNATYDAAYANWGSSWRMPTMDDFTALANACTGGYTSGNFSPTDTKASFEAVTATAMGVYWITNYNSGDKIKGLVFCDGTNKLFFPAAGYGNGASLSAAGDGSRYWSSTLNSSSPYSAYRLFFSSSLVFPQDLTTSFYGFPVRPVSD